MKLECTLTREDLKSYLRKKRRFANVIFLILGIYFFFSFMKYAFQDINTDKSILWLGFTIYFVVLLLLLFAFTKLYIFLKVRKNDKNTKNAYGKYLIEANDKEIISKVGSEKISYHWKEITSFKVRRNYFILKTKKDKIGLCFRRETLKDDYDKLLLYVKKKMHP